MLATIIRGIRQVSDADIILLESTPTGEPMYPIYKTLGYNFPRVLMLDVIDSTLVEVDNPLPKPFAVPTFWVPNVILSSDYLITLAPLKVVRGQGYLSLMNSLSILPSSKYGSEADWNWSALYELGIEKVVADLYFTLPFDLGIIEANQKFIATEDFTHGEIIECGKVLIGEPYEVDCEAADLFGIDVSYLDLIRDIKRNLNI